MTRLPRSRKGKTPIDVTITDQNGVKRVRLTVGQDNGAKKNSDLDAQEVADLVTMLAYNVGIITGNIEDPEPESEPAPDVWFVENGEAERLTRIVRAEAYLQTYYPITYKKLSRRPVLRRFVIAMLEGHKVSAIEYYREGYGEIPLSTATADVEYLSGKPQFMTYQQLGI